MHRFFNKISSYYPIPWISFPKNKIIQLIGDFEEKHLSILYSVLASDSIFFYTKTDEDYEFVDMKYYLETGKTHISHGKHDIIKTGGFILKSSGTTGQPKFILYSFDKFVSKFENIEYKPIKTLMFMDIDHIGGMDVLFSVVSRGGEVIFLKSRNPKDVCDAAVANDINFLTLTPTFLNLILLSECKLDTIKTINFGAEPMPQSLLSRLKEKFPHITFKQTFGTSETGTIQVKQHPLDPTLIQIPGSKIIDGKLYIKSNHGMIGYLNHPNPLTEDGYFLTGDLVECVDGYIRILGRTSEIVNIGGEKVSLVEVENILLSIPEVKDVMVASEKNMIVGNTLVAHVVWNSTKDCKQTIVDYLKPKVSKYKIPSKFRKVEAIPHSSRFKKIRCENRVGR